MNTPIQQPLELYLTEQREIFRYQLPPDIVLMQMAPQPSQQLVNDIARHWIREPLTVVEDPDGKKARFSLAGAGWQHGNITWDYYPVAGHRRTLAISKLVDTDWVDADGVNANERPIPVIVLKGLTISQGLKVVRIQEAMRTANENVETYVIRETASQLGIDITDQGAAKQIAHAMGVPKQASRIQRQINLLLMGNEIMEGYLKGQISSTVLKQVLSLKDTKGYEQIAVRLQAGEHISFSDVHDLRISRTQLALQQQATQSEFVAQPAEERIWVKNSTLATWRQMLYDHINGESGDLTPLGNMMTEIEELLQE
jgi:hypothetical protein